MVLRDLLRVVTLASTYTAEAKLLARAYAVHLGPCTYVRIKLWVSFCVLSGDPTPAQHSKKPQAVLELTFIVALPPNSSMTGLLCDIYIYTYVHTPTHTTAHTHSM